MSDKHYNSKIKRLKTGAFERRFSMAKAGLLAGSRFAAQTAGTWFIDKDQRAEKRKHIVAQQTQYLVDEIGKLKGSVVKIGQMMALYGEHFLPPEVTTALHTLEDHTAALEWTAIEQVLEEELGADALSKLTIETEAIGAASIGQVHRATRISDGRQICLKVQYPGVAEAIDSDLDAVAKLLKLTRLVPISEEFEQWLDEIRNMMYREVDYRKELTTTRRFRERLIDDPRFIVPEVFPEFSSQRVIATAYEPGYDVDAAETLALPQERRNRICEAVLDLCWSEVFSWGEMQTDPNFGNFFVRFADPNTAGDIDRVVLIDFGAFRRFPENILIAGKRIVRGAFAQDAEMIWSGIDHLKFLSENTPEPVRQSLIELCQLAIEPFVQDSARVPANLIDESGAYLWGDSDLATRLAIKSSASAISKYFAVPPKEVMFLVRKIMGSYTFMSVLHAKIKGAEILKPYLTLQTS